MELRSPLQCPVRHQRLLMDWWWWAVLWALQRRTEGNASSCNLRVHHHRAVTYLSMRLYNRRIEGEE